MRIWQPYRRNSARKQRISTQSSKVVEHYLFFETTNFHQIVPLYTLNAVLTKLTKLFCPKIRKCPGHSPQTSKKSFLSKRIFFSKRFCRQVDLSKLSAKLSKKFCSRSHWGKNDFFRKQIFFREHAPLDNWNAVLSALPKHFWQIFGEKFGFNPRMTWCF